MDLSIEPLKGTFVVHQFEAFADYALSALLSYQLS